MTKQYQSLCKRITDEGTWVLNERTQKKCLTVINEDLTYDRIGDTFKIENGIASFELEIVTTRKSYWKASIAELIGFIRGFDNASQFRAVGTKTWDKNANENDAWLNNPNRKGTDDLGRIYGVQGRRWIKHDGSEYDQLLKITEHLSIGIDDRGEIWLLFNPGEEELGCLRPCVYKYHFSLLGGYLTVNADQRSCDVPLGLNFNMVQIQVFLFLMAIATGTKPKAAYHKIINAHFYEDQYDTMVNEQLKREPLDIHPILSIDLNAPELRGKAGIEFLESVEVKHFWLEGYDSHPPLKYEMTA